MSLLKRLFGIWAINKTVTTTTPLFMRLILGMAVLTLLAVFASVLFAIVVAACAWFGYTQLIICGISSVAAFSIVFLILVALMLILCMVLQHHWRKLQQTLQHILYMQAPISSSVSILTDAFFRGYGKR